MQLGKTGVNGRNRALIGANSNNNVVLQQNHIENLIVSHSGASTLSLLGQLGQYDMIQQHIKEMLSSAATTHPLYPEFSAKYSTELDKLVSTPETETALTNHPKIIKGSFRIDYSKYPYMSKEESPWEYAYRTQTTVELETEAYQEYLGDQEDPFPILTFREGMTTVIGAPTFPEAVSATVVSGNVSIPILLRRLPCLEYGQILFGNVSENDGFILRLYQNEGPEEGKMTLTKTDAPTLEALILREELLNQFRETNSLQVCIGEEMLVNVQIRSNSEQPDMLSASPVLLSFFKSLLHIEQHFGCHFDHGFEGLSVSDFNTAFTIAASLNEGWARQKLTFDNEVRCSYDAFPETDYDPAVGCISYESASVKINLLGVSFVADKYIIAYHGAKINNIASVQKNIRKKRSNILVTFKPTDGSSQFIKSTRFEGLRLS